MVYKQIIAENGQGDNFCFLIIHKYYNHIMKNN